jgi:uncharacterized protein YecE (DUF72 family)
MGRRLSPSGAVTGRSTFDENRSLKIGTAAWAIPRDLRNLFAAEGSLLQHYAARFEAVEINSTFYRAHRFSTYARWAASTPVNFRFSAKLPRTITHDLRLQDASAALAVFLSESSVLREKLDPILIQLPPSLPFDHAIAVAFFSELRALAAGGSSA